MRRGVCIAIVALAALAAASSSRADGVDVRVLDQPFPVVWVDEFHFASGQVSTTGGMASSFTWATAGQTGSVIGTARNAAELQAAAFSGSTTPAAGGIDWGRVTGGCPVRGPDCSGKASAPERVIQVLGSGAVDFRIEGGGFSLDAGGSGHCGQTATSPGTPCSYEVVEAANPGATGDRDVEGTAVVTDRASGATLATIPLHAFFLKAIPYAMTATIAGTATAGAKLTAHATWEWDADSVAYAWQRCDAAGGSCAAIGGATDATYAPAAPDVGHRLRVVVTGSTDGGSWPVTSDPTAVVTAAQPAAQKPSAPSSAPSSTPASSGSSSPPAAPKPPAKKKAPAAKRKAKARKH